MRRYLEGKFQSHSQNSAWNFEKFFTKYKINKIFVVLIDYGGYTWIHKGRGMKVIYLYKLRQHFLEIMEQIHIVIVVCAQNFTIDSLTTIISKYGFDNFYVYKWH